MNIQAACHTAQDKTRMHAHSHKETERGAQVSEPRHESETQDMSAGIQHETRHTRSRALT